MAAYASKSINIELGFLLVQSIVLVFSALVPTAILAGRFAVKRQRQEFLIDLVIAAEDTLGKDIRFIPAFEFALQKYDLTYGKDGIDRGKARTSRKGESFFYIWTFLIFVVISWIGFSFVFDYASRPGIWRNDIFSFSSYGGPSASEELYRRLSGGVLAFSFLGAYAWSLNYLIGRISNFDLSPTSFLRVSARIILACATALVLRHILNADGQGVFPDTLVLLFAFVIGFYPYAGLDYLLQRIPQLRTKRMDDETAATMRSMPVEIIDGVDSAVSFRLAEREVVDVQNLATENPIILCAETPYTPLEVLDWVSQAQLALELGPRSYRQLRDIGIRNIFALEKAADDPKLTSRVLNIIYGNSGSYPDSIKPLLNQIRANVHVERLSQIYDIMQEVYTKKREAVTRES